MPLTVDSDFSPIKVTGTTTTDQEVISPKNSLIKIKFVYWYNITTEGDLCVLTDEFGHEIIKMRCETDGESQMWPIYTVYASIHCNDMDSGTLYIYH